jgi:hypothetical protein
MPLAVAVSAAFSAWAERQPRSARQYRLNAMAGDDVAHVDEDSALFE